VTVLPTAALSPPFTLVWPLSPELLLFSVLDVQPASSAPAPSAAPPNRKRRREASFGRCLIRTLLLEKSRHEGFCRWMELASSSLRAAARSRRAEGSGCGCPGRPPGWWRQGGDCRYAE